MRDRKEDNMSEVNSFGHGEFIERIAAYLSGGLEGAERSAFEAHRDACASCAAELQRAQDADRMLAGMFANVQPGGGFEDRIVRELRTTHRPMSLPHPMVLKVASGVAAAILLGAVGFVGNYLIENNKLPGAAKVGQGQAISELGRSPQQHAWAFDADSDKTWNEKDGKWGLQTDNKTREIRQKGRQADPQAEPALQQPDGKRGESEELRDAISDGSKVAAQGLHREVDAFKAETAEEGKPQGGGGGMEGRSRGFSAGLSDGC